MTEQWRFVAGLSAYEVSSFGRVRNAVTGHILKPWRAGRKGPGQQRSKVRLAGKNRDIAHLVLEAFIALRSNGLIAMHADDDSTNNDMNNLSWGTPSQNNLQTALKKRYSRQKLTFAQTKSLLARGKAGEDVKVLAVEFGVSPQRVRNVIAGRRSAMQRNPGSESVTTGVSKPSPRESIGNCEEAYRSAGI